MKYIQVYDGDIFPIARTWTIRCCDCALVHKLTFARAPQKVRVVRNLRATAAARRGKKYRGMKLPR